MVYGSFVEGLWDKVFFLSVIVLGCSS
jgi:hypothetical protein